MPTTQGIYQPNYFAHVAVNAETGPNGVIRFGEALLAIEISPPSQAGSTWPDAHAAISKQCPYIRLNLTDKSYTANRPSTGNTSTGAYLDAIAMKAFLQECGASVSDDDLAAAAEELARMLRSAQWNWSNWSPRGSGRNAKAFAVQSDYSNIGFASPVRLPGLSSFATWTLIIAVSSLVLFFLALRFIVHRRRRLLSSPVVITTPAATRPASATPPAHS